MHLETCKRMVSHIMSGPSQREIDFIFKGLLTEPHMVGLGALQAFVSEQSEEKNSSETKALACQAFIAGVAFSYASSTPQIQKLISDFFDHYAKSQGENIVNFSDFAARRQ